MHRFDLSPLFRSTIGFDRLASLLDSASRPEDQSTSYPPYNIEKRGENEYCITMAIAGFAAEDLSIVAQSNSLAVSGKLKKDESQAIYLHRGIAGRAFERRFDLADHIRVGGARLENGLLHIDLVREIPEAMKPRNIAINTVASQPAPTAAAIEIEQHAA